MREEIAAVQKAIDTELAAQGADAGSSDE